MRDLEEATKSVYLTIFSKVGVILPMKGALYGLSEEVNHSN